MNTDRIVAYLDRLTLSPPHFEGTGRITAELLNYVFLWPDRLE